MEGNPQVLSFDSHSASAACMGKKARLACTTHSCIQFAPGCAVGPADYDQRSTKTDGPEAGAEGYGGDAKVASEGGHDGRQKKERQETVGVNIYFLAYN
eukprot:scaffold155053_cov19-Tisochrysis_lutea.AAC.1